MQSAGEYQPIQDWSDRKRRRHKKYVVIWVPEHPKNFAGWYYEHRLVVERERGTVLPTEHTVHHISEVKDDNSILNLFVCLRSEHDKAC